MKYVWRHARSCALVFLAWAPVSMAQPTVPAQLKAVTNMLRKLHEPDLANTIETDFKAGRSAIGATGGEGTNAETGVGWMDRSFILRPIAGVTGLGTGTTENRMTISNKILNDISTDPRAEKTDSYTKVVMGWAITLRHEAVHMGQRAPGPTPEFENPAYRETIKSGVAWYRTTKAELVELLSGPPTRANLELAAEVRMRLDAIGVQVNSIFDDMPPLFDAGSLAQDTWMTLDGGRATTHSDARSRNWRTIADDKTTLDEALRKQRDAAAAPAAPSPTPSALPAAPPPAPTPAAANPPRAPVTPIGAPDASPSSATAAGAGAWILEGVKDQTHPSKALNQGSRTFSPGKIAFEGSSVASSDVLTYRDGATFNRQSSSSWTEFPKTLVAGGPETVITLNTSFQPDSLPPSIVSTSIQEGESSVLSVTATGRESRAFGLPAAAPRWFLRDRGPLPRMVFEVSHRGPGGTASRTYTYTWQDGATAPGLEAASNAMSLGVQIEIDKPTLVPGDTALLKATVKGGAAPYTYRWTGAASGATATLPFPASRPGRYDFIVIVIDANGETASAAFKVDVDTLTVTIALASGSPRVPIGQPLSFRAQVSLSGGAAPPSALVYRWQPNPEAKFTPVEGALPQASAVFMRPGRVKVWVDVLRVSGTVLSTLAESNQLEIEVVGPEISLRMVPAQPYPGQEVRITASENPGVGDAFITYWWEYAGHAINPGAEANPRIYSLRSKDTTPVTVTAHAKAKDGGANLGVKDIVVTARPHTVQVTPPMALGPKPRIWNPQGGGLVEVLSQLAVFQDVSVRADVTPSPINQPLRYAWSITPEGCLLSNPISQEPTINCNQAGAYNVAVTVQDSLGATIGAGSGRLPITLSAADLQASQNQAIAAGDPLAQQRDLQARRETADRLRKEGEVQQQQGKLREAVAKYRESLKYLPDPAMEAYIVQVEAAALKQEQATRAAAQVAAGLVAAQKLYDEGLQFIYQGKVTEGLVKYQQSLALLRESGDDLRIRMLEQEIGVLDTEIARRQRAQAQQEAEEAARAARAAATALAGPSPAPAGSSAAPPVDPRQREKGLKLRREGEEEEAKQKPTKAIEKYRESLELLPDPALEQRVRALGPLAEREELEKRAKRLKDLGRALEGLNQPRAAAKKYRESNALIPDPDLERKARKLDAEAGQESGAQQIAEELEAERQALERQLAERRAPAQPNRTAPRTAPPPSATPKAPPNPPAPPQPQSGGAPATASCSATGEWVIEGGGAILFLHQAGNQVSGRKDTVSMTDDNVFVKENISGTFSDNVLRLAWSIPTDQTLLGTMAGTCASMRITVSYTLPSTGTRSSYTVEMNRRR